MKNKISVFAPATVANLACGFDVLGLALDGLGDTVHVSLREDSKIVVESITGDGGKLSIKSNENTSSVAISALRKIVDSERGFSIAIEKGLPLGSGLGSSAASGVAALVAANELLGSPLTRAQLLPCAMESERVACGAAHADNVAPGLLGGIVLIRSYSPLDTVVLSYPEQLACIVVTPLMELKTSDARMVLRKQIRLADAIVHWGNLAGLVAGFISKDFSLIGRSLKDDLIEPERAVLIPGFYKVKQAALDSGALGCSISGSGPSIFALVSDQKEGAAVGKAMQEAFSSIGLESTLNISKINPEGARIL